MARSVGTIQIKSGWDGKVSRVDSHRDFRRDRFFASFHINTAKYAKRLISKARRRVDHELVRDELREYYLIA